MPGTAQGCWFLLGTSETYPEDPHLALVRSNTHPDYAVLSTGNSVPNLASGAYEFLPENSGLLNRGFQDIVPDGQVYGFRVNQFGGVIILHMPDAETLWIEVLQERTIDSANWGFTEDKVEFRW